VAAASSQCCGFTIRCGCMPAFQMLVHRDSHSGSAYGAAALLQQHYVWQRQVESAWGRTRQMQLLVKYTLYSSCQPH
jgi:hypothetical protein